jgi:2-phospho-L-lactate guanylyltransferase
MKEPKLSKTRLDPFLSSGQRQALALRMFTATLAFFTQHFSQHHLLVVTGSMFIASVARRYGATVLMESTPGLRQAADSATRWSISNDFESQLLIPADIAHLDVDEVQLLLQAQRPVPSVVLTPADDLGTNALLTTPPDAIPFLYGIDSSLAHQQAAEQRAISFQLLELPELALDVDTPADIDQLTLLSSPLIEELYPTWKHA